MLALWQQRCNAGQANPGQSRTAVTNVRCIREMRCELRILFCPAEAARTIVHDTPPGLKRARTASDLPSWVQHRACINQPTPSMHIMPCTRIDSEMRIDLVARMHATSTNAMRTPRNNFNMCTFIEITLIKILSERRAMFTATCSASALPQRPPSARPKVNHSITTTASVTRPHTDALV